MSEAFEIYVITENSNASDGIKDEHTGMQEMERSSHRYWREKERDFYMIQAYICILKIIKKIQILRRTDWKIPNGERILNIFLREQKW